jgi:hypothetical protein
MKTHQGDLQKTLLNDLSCAERYANVIWLDIAPDQAPAIEDICLEMKEGTPASRSNDRGATSRSRMTCRLRENIGRAAELGWSRCLRVRSPTLALPPPKVAEGTRKRRSTVVL